MSKTMIRMTVVGALLVGVLTLSDSLHHRPIDDGQNARPSDRVSEETASESPNDTGTITDTAQ